MKITFELEECKCVVEDPSCVDIFDTFELVKQGLLGIGFHPESVKDGFSAMHDQQESSDLYLNFRPEKNEEQLNEEI